MELIEIITIAGGIASAIMGVITLLCFLVKPIRERIIGHNNKNAAQDAALCCILRHEILQIYNKNRLNKILTEDEYQDLVKMYEAYVALGGNSFICKRFEEMSTWQII